jgi:translation initiation factor 5A
MKEDKPCKVIDMSTSKTGKHGSAKYHFIGINIFTGEKCEDLQSIAHTVQVPIVTRKEYQLIEITEEGFTSLMDDSGNTREDIELPKYPDNLAKEIKDAFASGKDIIVIVLRAMGHEQIISLKR